MANSALIGCLINDRFLIKSQLAAGGFGSIYIARQVDFDRDVAVKFLHSDLVEDDESMSRFAREARILAGLTHNNIVSCYAHGVWVGKMPYLVFELLQGRNLRQVLNAEKTLSWQRTFSIGADVCSALSHAHNSGIIHRDIKPENIFITDDGTVKLIDFGLSHVNEQKLTQTGALIGTAQYMSPEQSLGEKVGPWTDLYSLGSVLYECIAGNPPFVSDNPFGLMYMHRMEPVPPLVSSSEPLDSCIFQILSMALAKDAKDRFATAGEFGAALANPESFSQRGGKLGKAARRRNWSLRAPALVLVVAALVAGCAFLMSGNILAVGLEKFGRVLPLHERIEFYTQCCKVLQRSRSGEGAMLLLRDCYKDARLPLVERLSLVSQCLHLMKELNYTSEMVKTFDESVSLIRLLKFEDIVTQAQRDQACEALMMLDDVAVASGLGQRNDDYPHAKRMVTECFFLDKDYSNYARCRSLAVTGDTPLHQITAFIITMTDLGDAKQWSLMLDCLHQEERALRSRGKHDRRAAELFRQLSASVALRQKKETTVTGLIIDDILPWITSAGLTSDELYYVLRAICTTRHERRKFEDLANFFPFLQAKLNMDNAELSNCEPYFKLLKAQWLISQRNRSAACSILCDLVRTGPDDYACQIAGNNGITAGANRSLTGRVDHKMLDEMAAAIKSRQYQDYESDLASIYRSKCYDYADNKQPLAAAESARQSLSYTSPEKQPLAYSSWSAILGGILEHDNKSQESERVVDAGIALVEKLHGTDADTCELLCLKGFHLAKRHDKSWKNYQSRAEIGSKRLSNAAITESVFRTRTYSDSVDPE